MFETKPLAPSDLKLVVTGGARGIGAATAVELAGIGAKVFLTDVLPQEGNALAESLGPNAAYADLDVTEPSAWQSVLAQAESFMGGVNALFNNAGIVLWGNTTGTNLEDFRKVIDVNLYGVFLGMRFAAPLIKSAGGGCIINVSSTAGLQGYAGITAYVASKWGVRGMTKAAALDLAADGIRVLSLHPGPIRTPMTSGLDESMAASQPIARFGESEEVARMARFMFLEATYSTGSEFTIDGGAVTGQIQPVAEG